MLAKSSMCVVFFMFAIRALSQAPEVTHTAFGKEDGIALDNITDLVFDDDGFLWLGGTILTTRDIIATDNTIVLQRFNGKTFHNIPIPKSFGVTKVEKFYKRPDGNFILRADGRKLLSFNPKTTAFKKIELDVDAVSEIVFWDGKEFVLGQKGRQLTLIELHNDLTTTPLFSFTSSENKILVRSSTKIIRLANHWLIGDQSFALKVFTEDGAFVKEIGVDTKKQLDNVPRILRITEYFQLHDTTVVVLGSSNTLHYIDEKALDILPLDIPNNKISWSNIKYIANKKGNSLLMSEIDGSLRFHNISAAKGVETWYQKQQFNTSLALRLKSQDVTKDLWIATSKGELHYYQFQKKNITQVLPEYQFRAITQLNDSTYLMSTEQNGWHILNTANLTTEKVVFEAESNKQFPNGSRNFIKEGDYIWSNSGSGMIRANLADKKVQFYSHYPLTSIERINDSVILGGTNKYHLLSFNIRSQRFEEILKTDTLNMHDLAYHKATNFLAIATSQGLLTYNTKTKEHVLYNEEMQLKDSYLLMVDYHPEYGFLLGSRSGTIVSFDEKTKRFTTLYEDALSAGIATLVPRGDVWWVNTFNGYVRWNIKENTVNRFSDTDGFSHNEANRYSVYDSGEMLFIGSISGLNYFDPETIAPSENISKLKLLKIRRYNKNERRITNEFDQSTFVSVPAISLPAEQKELQVDYALTHNVENKPHSFQYRLNNDPWINIGQEQQIRFPNMAVGTYALQIEALDFSGKKLGDTLLLNIDSKEFFYRTWWFYLLLSSGAVFLLLYFLWQSKSKQRMQEKFSVDLLMSQEKERNHIAKELHDSVGQQLTLIKKTAQKKGDENITSLTNNVLEEVRGISRGLYPANLKLLGLTESIEQLVYDLDEQTNTFFSIDITPVDTFFNETETLNVFRFIQECLTNSIKHSDATAVEVLIKVKQHTIVIQVSDNGNGFAVTDATIQNSLGLKTLAERIKIVKGTLEIQSKLANGTTITANIPKK